MADYTFGTIPGIQEEQLFKDRKELRKAGIHLALQAGIDGNSNIGAPSIILNGGYVDDYDLGEEILYTDHGGNDPRTKRQIADQSWDSPGNKALIVSEMHGLPVRVTRGYRHISSLSPKEGYRYGGLYSVVQHFQEKGKDGFIICRFKLEKLPLQENNTIEEEPFPGFSKEDKSTARVLTTILRIVRDTKVARQVKKLYNYTCQICGVRIEVCGVGYAEAAHIKPLGNPHNGADTRSNIICLCPNHHVMLDKGAIGINNDLTLIGMPGKIRLAHDHHIDKRNLEYHKEHIYIDYPKTLH